MHTKIPYFSGIRSLQRQDQDHLVIKSGIILISLLTPRILTTFFSFGRDITTFRIFYALFIVFDFLIPIILTIVFFQRVNIILSFTIPFIIYGILCPIIDAAWLSYQGHIIINPIPVQTLFGGIGLGIIGLGSSQTSNDRVIAGIAVFLGIIALMVSIPDFCAIVGWVVTGDPDALLQLL